MSAKLAKITHPLYQLYYPTWQQLQDIYEGAGGFLHPDKPYLMAHPREWLDHSIRVTTQENGVDAVGTVPNPSPSLPSPKLKMRRKLARYENIAEAILSTIEGALFRTAASRTFKRPSDTLYPIQSFWADATGPGLSIDRLMRQSWLASGVFGHVLLLVDKPGEMPETAADTRTPTAKLYTPIDILDWLVDPHGVVTAVKLMEPMERDDFGQVVKPTDYQIRIVDAEKWQLYTSTGKLIDESEHGMGRLPVVWLYGKRRPLTPVVGKSIIGDPMLHIDCYNLVSEERELLRNQTFAILNVPVGPDGDIEQEKARIGQQAGTANVMFSSQAVDYVSPEGTNVEVYQSHRDRLSRMIYRLASAAWDGDSRDAESGESRRIKREEQQQVLANYASELQASEDLLTELVYRALYGDRWEIEYQQQGPVVRYPDRFEPPNWEEVIETVSGALTLELGQTATKEMKKRASRALLPELPMEMQSQIDAEIEAQGGETADDRRDALIAATRARFTADAPETVPEV